MRVRVFRDDLQKLIAEEAANNDISIATLLERILIERYDVVREKERRKFSDRKKVA